MRDGKILHFMPLGGDSHHIVYESKVVYKIHQGKNFDVSLNKTKPNEPGV